METMHNPMLPMIPFPYIQPSAAISRAQIMKMT